MNCPKCGRLGMRQWDGWECLVHGSYWEWSGREMPADMVLMGPSGTRRIVVKLPGEARSKTP